MSSDPSDGPIQKGKNGQIKRPNSDVNGQEMVKVLSFFSYYAIVFVLASHIYIVQLKLNRLLCD